MACCASSRPLLDGFFSRSAASFASRSLRKRSVFWARSSRCSSCSSFNERFVGALGFFFIVASCVNVFGRCARFIGALGFFSVASCSRFIGWGLPQMLLLSAVLRQHLFFRVHGTMGAKRRRQSRMQFAPSHGRSLKPRGGGAERSNYSCHPSIVSNRLG